MNYQGYNDYELIYMIQENDENSKGILYEKYFPIIRSIASSFYDIYKNSGYDYDDFVQEGMIGFQKALVSYDENKGSLFYTFVIVCIRRHLISFTRKISRSYKDLSFFPIGEGDEVNIPDTSSNLELIMDEYEIQHIYMDIIYNASLLEGAILELKINDFTYREISVLLDIPLSSVEFKSRRVRKTLKNKLSQYYCK